MYSRRSSWFVLESLSGVVYGMLLRVLIVDVVRSDVDGKRRKDLRRTPSQIFG